MRCLKRRISEAVYRQLLADAAEQTTARTGPGGRRGASHQSSAVDLPPHIDTSDQPLPTKAATPDGEDRGSWRGSSADEFPRGGRSYLT